MRSSPTIMPARTPLPIMNRVPSISLVLAFVLAAACSSETTPQGPIEPELETSGDFELTVEVTGTRPDADGYDVAITLTTGADPLMRSVEPGGGTLLLSQLPAGTHVLRVQGLAFQCRVTGTHPVSFTIQPGARTRAKISISCPGPGAPPAPAGSLEVRLTGHPAVVLGGSRVAIQVNDVAEPLIRFASRASTLISAIPPGTHSLRVEPVADDCAAGEAGGNPFTIVAGQVTTIELAASCPPVHGSLAGSYEREIPVGETPWYLSERFVLQADGFFRLEYADQWGDIYELSGAFFQESGSAGTVLRLLFSSNPGSWTATATLEAGCLDVDYSLDMELSDFASGRYCR